MGDFHVDSCGIPYQGRSHTKNSKMLSYTINKGKTKVVESYETTFQNTKNSLKRTRNLVSASKKVSGGATGVKGKPGSGSTGAGGSSGGGGSTGYGG